MQVYVDYRDVQPISNKKTLSYVNNFIINTTQFLNRFNYLCEQKLSDISNQIQRLEISMSLLEIKLGSVDGLESLPPKEPRVYTPYVNSVSNSIDQQIQQDTNSSSSVNNNDINLPNIDISGSIPPPPPPPPSLSSTPSMATLPIPSNNIDSTTSSTTQSGNFIAYKDDPRYKPFFDLQQKKVPLMAFQSKMLAMGLNPNALLTPDDPSDGAQLSNSSSNTISSSNSNKNLGSSDSIPPPPPPPPQIPNTPSSTNLLSTSPPSQLQSSISTSTSISNLSEINNSQNSISPPPLPPSLPNEGSNLSLFDLHIPKPPSNNNNNSLSLILPTPPPISSSNYDDDDDDDDDDNNNNNNSNSNNMILDLFIPAPPTNLNIPPPPVPNASYYNDDDDDDDDDDDE